MSEATLLDLNHREAVIELERVSRLGESTGERFTLVMPCPHLNWNLAAEQAVEVARLGGRLAAPRKIALCQAVEGFCRDCGELVCAGGRGRIRHGEVRCFGCGGGP